MDDPQRSAAARTRRGVRMLLLVSLSVLATVIVTPTLAQESLPTDAELRSAYCIPVLQWQITWHQEMVSSANKAPAELPEQASQLDPHARENIEQLQAALNRLQSYLLPRIGHRDSSSMLLATSRGQSDLKALSAMTERCSAKCVIAGTPDDAKRACFDSCTDKDLVSRIRACANPTWLPF